MTGIIDYQMGNLRSVQKALEHLGAQASILASPSEVAAMDHLILPGVGAFADGMEHLRRGGWVDPMKKFIHSGKPFLGICLGMQLLFDGSQEHAPDPETPVPGLGVLPGDVVMFRHTGPGSDRLKVPHMGWNTLEWQREDPLLRGLNQGDAVYFVHGYYVKPKEESQIKVTSAWSDYGRRFCASIWHQNIWATQFHPEKSQQVGLDILANFASF